MNKSQKIGTLKSLHGGCKSVEEPRHGLISLKLKLNVWAISSALDKCIYTRVAAEVFEERSGTDWLDMTKPNRESMLKNNQESENKQAVGVPVSP